MALTLPEVGKWLKEMAGWIKDLFNNNNPPPAGSTTKVGPIINVSHGCMNVQGNIVIGNNNNVSFKLLNKASDIQNGWDITINESFRIDYDGIPMWLYIESDKSEDYACIGVYISCSSGGEEIQFWIGGYIKETEKELVIYSSKTKGWSKIKGYDSEAILDKLVEVLKKQFSLPS